MALLWSKVKIRELNKVNKKKEKKKEKKSWTKEIKETLLTKINFQKKKKS